MAEQVPTSQAVPEHQDRGLFDHFGKKKEEQELGMQTRPATHTQPQTQAAHLYPTNPPHAAAAVDQQNGQGYGHGHEGQYTAAGEADQKQQHSTGLMGKLHRTHSSSSSSSSDEEEGGKMKEGGRKKKGPKDKIKEKLPGGGEHSSDECGGIEEEKEVGLLDKIKEKLPGKHETKIEEEKKVDEGRIEEEEKVDESRIEEEKKVSLLDKIKEKLPGHRNKKDLEEEEKKQQY